MNQDEMDRAALRAEQRQYRKEEMRQGMIDMAMKVSRLATRRLPNGDEAHQVQFNDGTRWDFYFSGGPATQTNTDGTRERLEIGEPWEGEPADPRWDALQEEYLRIDGPTTPIDEEGYAIVIYPEMTDSEFSAWKEAMN